MRARICLFTIIIAAVLALTGLAARAVGLDWSAASLTGLGRYPEVNAGTGALVVSGDTAGEVWRIDPATGSYTVYGGLTSVRDARPDAAGNIWVANWSDKALVRIDAGGTATSWPIGAVVLWGVAFDDAGRVWVADDASSRVFRFNPTSHQLCTYTLPGGGRAEYMVNRNGALWLGEYANGRIVRLDPTADTVGAAWWEIGSTSYPEGLAVDAAGHVWFADYTLNFLGRLDLSTNQLTRYTPPIGTVPAMVALVADRLWYTEEGLGTVGVLDPSVAAGQTAPVATGSGNLSPSCTILGAGTPTTVTTRSGTLAFADLSPTLLVDAGGWTVYGLPAGSKPWGIAEAAGSVWIADGGRQKLLRVSESTGSTATPTATATATATSTATPTTTATAIATSTATPTATATATATSTATPTATATATATSTATPTATASATAASTATPTATATVTPTATRAARVFLPLIIK